MRIVLVHGAGGSPLTWSLVAPLLEAPGREVILVDHPSQSRAGDVATVRAILDQSPDDALLVGHSYGGAVITDAGRHQRARGLVYVAAFAPEDGESIDDIVARHGAAEVFQGTPRASDGEMFMPGAADDDWARHSWDVPEAIRIAAARQRRPISVGIFTSPSGPPAWDSLPSWYLIATRDKHLRPEAQRAMALRAGAVIAEVDTSHAAPHAAPERVAAIIESALGAIAGVTAEPSAGPTVEVGHDPT